MTSQHFDDGWDNWGEDWAGNSNFPEGNNNNSRHQSSQPNQPFNPQQQQQPATVTGPIYSPFAYSTPAVSQHQQLPPPSHSQQQQWSGNAVNFFNPSHFNSDNANNNPNPMGAYNTVQSPIQTSATSVKQPITSISSATPPMYNIPHEIPHTDVTKSTPPQNVQYQSNIQHQQQQGFPPPPPPHTMTTNNPTPPSFYDPNQHQKQFPFYQTQHPAAPPPSQSNQQPNQLQQEQNQQQFSQWNDQQNNYQNWPMMNQNVYNQSQQPQQPPVSSNSSNDWERISPDSIQFLQQQTAGVQQQPDVSAPLQNVGKIEEQANFTPPPANYHQQLIKSDNVENNQIEAATFNTPQFIQPPSIESSYPENRERLDEVSTPLRPPSSSSSIDRHNYLVTGQLSNESHQPTANEMFPPPGLSRMVVGEPENNQEQLPSHGHRMVTGTEMTPASYMNYQRQADGEVSQSPTIAPPVRPPSHPPSFAQSHDEQQNVNQQQQQQQQNFNVGDRNLYLVAGESDMNNQRVIPGVESDNSLNNINNNANNNNNSNVMPMNIINPLQNLHIEDDEDFVNISVSSQHRNVDGDGMEEQRGGLMINTGEQREEDIEGANDNNSENIQQQINDQELETREVIEGANDPIPSSANVKSTANENLETRRSFDKKLKPESSEDSELREVERISKSKSRRSKKYDTNDSESEIDEEYKDKKRDKYEERYKRSSNRDRMSREEYEKYRRREKERRSGGGGSRYGEGRRRTDDEDEGRRNKDKYKGRGREDDDEGIDDREKRKERRREGGGRRKDYDEDRDRRERRRRDRYYDDDYQSGRRSQNTSDREFDRYSRRSRGGAAYDAPGYYGYDTNQYNYNSIYYQQQQYLESLRRTNPQAYEWYKNYYGMMQQQQAQMQQQVPANAMDDIGGSLHSGYNSSSEKGRASTSRFLPGGNVSNPQRSLNTSFIDSTDHYPSLQASSSFQPIGKDFNQPYSSLNFNQGYGFVDTYGDLRNKPEVVPGRMTPKKFLCAHDYVKLSNGLMTTVDTLNNDHRYLVKIESVPIYDRSRRLYQSYPGPLVRGVSHKKTIIEFCEEKLKHLSHIEHKFRASYALLWSYLILMLRQNGTYTEADISELLMKNFDDFKNSLQDSSEKEENIENENDETDVSEESGDENNTTSEKNSNTVSHATQSAALTESNVLDKFKNYLLYGNINDALDYATDNNLWGHALFLASKVDRRQHANVMLKFANKLPFNDPLQTLYQIMSGRMPACVTNLDDKLGDWRPHLAMIISNCTDKPDLVKRSVIALGDSLASRGDIFGSQFCYLLMDPQFTDYSDSQMINGKIGLLGVSLQQRAFKEFATDDAIIMTEVYEYARSLSVENYFIASLQKYKFLLATNMLDYGMQLKCLLYMEHIAKCIVYQPNLFDVAFMAKIYDFGDRLKFYDPVLERAYEDGNEGTEDQKWLQDLYAVMSSNSYQQSVPSTIPTYNPNEVYNPVDQQQRHSVSSSGVYDPMSQQQTPTHQPYAEVEQTSYQDQQNSQIYNQNQDYQYQQPQQQQQSDFGNFSYQQNNEMRRESIPQNDQQNYLQPTPPVAANSYDPNAQINSYQPDYSYSNYDQNYQQPQQPTITMGNSVSKKYDEGDGETIQKNHESPVKKQQQEAEKPKKASPTQDANASAGWFGGIFSKLKSKSNQMKLPDDKNPSIVWDETNKRWINKDEDPSEAESFKPPPKMGEMMMQQQPPVQQPPSQFGQQQSALPTPINQQQQQQTPQIPYGVPQQQPQPQPQQPTLNSMPMNNQPSQPMATADQPVPPSAPNMFKLQKGRNLKKSYVDILGNSGQTVPATSKDVAPPQMDMQFFNPQVQQPQGMQFYNPNDFQ